MNDPIETLRHLSGFLMGEYKKMMDGAIGYIVALEADNNTLRSQLSLATEELDKANDEIRKSTKTVCRG